MNETEKIELAEIYHKLVQKTYIKAVSTKVRILERL